MAFTNEDITKLGLIEVSPGVFRKKRTRVITACGICGKDFVSFAAYKRKFCSPKCAYKGRVTPPQSKPKNRGKRLCLNCLRIFEVHTTAANAKYCSQKCAASHIGKRTIRTIPKKAAIVITSKCESCGADFKARKYKNKKCCSDQCAHSLSGINASKTLHANGHYKSAKPYSRCAAQWVQLGANKFYARSSWEANYGRYLEFLKSKGEIKSWEHEPDTFWFHGIKRGVMSYLPDFKVTTKAGSIEYHEVKGWMDAKSKTKIARMAKYHPKVKLIIIDAARYKGIAKMGQNIVPGWTTQPRKTP